MIVDPAVQLPGSLRRKGEDCGLDEGEELGCCLVELISGSLKQNIAAVELGAKGNFLCKVI